MRQSSTQRAYVDKQNNMRERIATMLESRRVVSESVHVIVASTKDIKFNLVASYIHSYSLSLYILAILSQPCMLRIEQGMRFISDPVPII